MFIVLTILLICRFAIAKDCEPPNLEFESFPVIKRMEVSKKIYIKKIRESDMDTQMCQMDARFEWRVFPVLDERTLGKQIPGVIKESTRESRVNEIDMRRAPDDTPFFTSKFALQVTSVMPKSKKKKVFTYKFLITPDDMEINIEYGARRVHTLGQGEIVLDATKSKDNSFIPEERALESYIFSWRCEPGNHSYVGKGFMIWTLSEASVNDLTELTCDLSVTRTKTPFFPSTVNASQTIVLIRPPTPELKVVCVSNCHEESDSFEETVVAYKCMNNCSQPNSMVYSHKPAESISGIGKFTDINGQVKYSAEFFLPGTTVVGSVHFGYDGYAELTWDYRIPKPDLALVCESGCEFDPRDEIVIKLICSGKDCKHNKYHWTGYAGFMEVSDVPNMTYVLQPFTLEDADAVNISVSAWDSTANIYFVLNESRAVLKAKCVFEHDKEINHCDSVDPREELQIQVECIENCKHLDYRWELHPPPSEDKPKKPFDIDSHLRLPAKDFLIIPNSTYKEKDEVVVKIFTHKTMTYVLVKFELHEPLLQIDCMSNCDPTSNPSFDVILQVKCVKYCRDLDYKWASPEFSTKHMEEAMLSEQKSILVIPKKLFSSGSTVKLSVKSGLGEYANATVEYADPEVSLTIICVTNCNNSNLLLETRFKVLCEPEEDSNCKNPDFVWSGENLPKNFSWRTVTFHEKNSTIVIQPYSIVEASTIKLTVTNRKSKADLDVVFDEPEPELVVTCHNNCGNAYISMQTNLSVVCKKNCERVEYTWFTSEKEPWIGDNTILGPKNLTMAIKKDVASKAITVWVQSRKTKSNQVTINYVQKLAPTFHFKCTPKECSEMHNPIDDLTVEMICDADCHADYNTTWSLEPGPKNTMLKQVQTHPKHMAITISGGTYENGDVVTAKFKTTLSDKEETQVLTFQSPDPVLELECVSNCWDANPFDTIIVQVVCKLHCDNIQVYNWTLEPETADRKNNLTLGPLHKDQKRQQLTIHPNSYDEKGTPTVTVKVKYKYKGGEVETSAVLNIKENFPELKLFCVFNCPLADPTLPVKLEATCTRWCDRYGEFEWTASKGDHYEYGRSDKGKESFGIKPNMFKVGDSVMVNVKFRKTDRYQQIYFVEPAPKLQLICITNCENDTIDPRLPFTYQVICYELCKNLSYEWGLDPAPFDDGWTSKVTYGDNNMTFTLQGHMYAEGSSSILKVGSKSTQLERVIRFRQPPPELHCKCTKKERTCNGENAFTDLNVLVTCTKNCEKMEYEWEVEPILKNFNDRNVSWNQTIFSSNDTLKIKAYTFRPKESAILTVKSGVGVLQCTIWFVHPPPQIRLKATPDPCPTCNPFRDTTIKVTCTFACNDVALTYRILPEPSPIHDFEYGIDYIRIPKFTYPNNTAIVVVATATVYTHENLTVEAFLYLTFLEKPPVLELQCYDNGFNNPAKYNPCHYHPNKPTKVRVVCLDNCEQLNYQWTFRELSPVLNLTNAGDIVTIPKAAYYDGDVVTVEAKVRNVVVNATLHFLFDPWEGNCVIEPLEGISGITDFFFECSEFTRLARFSVFQNGVELLPQQGRFSDAFWLAENPKSEIVIEVDGGFSLVKSITIIVTVLPMIQSEPHGRSGARVGRNKEIDMIRNKTFGTDTNDYKKIVLTGDFSRAVQLANALNEAAKKHSPKFYHHVKNHLLDGITYMNKPAPHGVEQEHFVPHDPLQVFSIYERLGEDVDVRYPPALQSILEGCGSSLKFINYHRHPLEVTIRVLDKAMQIISKALSTLRKVFDIPDDSPLITLSPNYPENTMISRHFQQVSDVYKSCLYRIFSILELIGETEMGRYTPFCLRADEIKICKYSIYFQEDRRDNRVFIDPNESYVQIDNILAHVEVNAKRPILEYTMAIYKDNPFFLNYESHNTEFVYFSLKANFTGLPTLDVYLKIRANNDKTKNTTTGTLTERTIIEYKLGTKSTLAIGYFYMVNNPYKVTMTACPPTDADFKETSFIVDSPDAVVVNALSDKQIYIGLEPLFINVNATECPPVDDKAGNPSTEPTEDIKEGNITNNTESTMYSFKMYRRNCISSKGINLDLDEVCTPSLTQPETHVHCLCSHFSHYAGMEIQAEMQPFASVTMSDSVKPVYSFLVPITMLALLALFLILLFIVRVRDSRIKKFTETYHLDDNVPGDEVAYLVIVSTGLCTDAGTTADVAFQFTGTAGKSRVHVIRGYTEEPLRWNSEHSFVVYTPKELGSLLWVKLWHNSKGRKPHWFCERIMVMHLRTRKVYTFMIERWFSLIYGDGTTYGRFQPTVGPIRLTFKQRFREALRHNHHLFTFLYGRPRLGTALETLMVGFLAVLLICAQVTVFLVYFNDKSLSTLLSFALLAAFIAVMVTSIFDFLFRWSA